MAEVKPLKAGATGIEQIPATDTIPVANVPDITSAKITDFVEAAQDAVGAMATDTATVNLTYTDGTPAFAADVITQMSITSDASGLKLTNDEASPGNSEYYGTDSGGVKGYFPLPSSGSETYTAGEALSARDLVYISAAGTVMKADANAEAKAAVGFVPSAISNGASGTVVFNDGKITGFTGLVNNARYFLSNTTTGGISLYAGLTYATADIQQQVGVAEGTTILRFFAGPTILIA